MWLDAIVVALVVLHIATFSLLWALKSRLRRALALTQSEASGIPALMIVNALNKIDHRLNQLERGAETTEAPKRSLEIRAIQMTTSANQQTVSSQYELAQLMARDGSDANELMERCGLSLHEAELMLRLHARRA